MTRTAPTGSAGNSPVVRVLAVALAATLALVLAPTTSAVAKNGAQQVSGTGVPDTGGECPPAPPDLDSLIDLPPLILSGDLEGCLYVGVEWFEDQGAPSGVYRETGTEVFVGTVLGGLGTFETTYRFTSKWDPDIETGVQLHGRCQHPIVRGSGTDDLAGISGRLDFKDDVDTGTIDYRGHVKLG